MSALDRLPPGLRGLAFRILGILIPLLILPCVLLATVLRRIIGLRAHPGWTFGQEVAFTSMHLGGRSGIGADPRFLQRIFVDPPKAWRLPGCDRVDAQVAGRHAEVTTPQGMAADAPTILYLHGGGYGFCSPATHRGLCADLARTSRMRVVALDYRLAPQHPFPAALDDAAAAWRELCQGSTGPMFVAGDSAGGGLSLALTLRLRDGDERLPTAVFAMSPWTDLTMAGPTHAEWAHLDYLPYPQLQSLAAAYVGDADRRSPLISPLHADLSGLPPILVQYGGAEVLRWDSEEFVRRAQAAGSPVEGSMGEGMIHVYQALAQLLPQGRQALREAGAWLKAKAADVD